MFRLRKPLEVDQQELLGPPTDFKRRFGEDSAYFGRAEFGVGAPGWPFIWLRKRKRTVTILFNYFTPKQLLSQ